MSGRSQNTTSTPEPISERRDGRLRARRSTFVTNSWAADFVSPRPAWRVQIRDRIPPGDPWGVLKSNSRSRASLVVVIWVISRSGSCTLQTNQGDAPNRRHIQAAPPSPADPLQRLVRVACHDAHIV